MATSTSAAIPGGLIGAQIPPDAAQTECARLQEDGIAVTALWVRWGEIDQGGGNYDWTGLDEQVNAYRDCGIEVGLHIQARSSADVLSTLPANLEDYTSFLTALVTHLKGRVSRYSLENEAITPYTWGDTAENYYRLLAAAYPAIKAADPDAIVLESATSATALGIMAAYSLYQGGYSQAALDLVRTTLYDTGGELGLHRDPSLAAFFLNPQAPGVRVSPLLSDRKEPTLDVFFQNPQVARVVSWIPLLIQSQGIYDAFQLHWYGPWQTLPVLVAWLRDQGMTKPIEMWELNKHYARDTYDANLYAEDMAKLLVTAAGEGSQVSILFAAQPRWNKGLPGLVGDDGQATAAEIAFRVVASHLNGFLAVERLDLGSQTRAYHFTRSEDEVYVLWTVDGQVTAALPVPGTVVTVTDLQGETSTADPSNLAVDTSPLCVVP